MKVVKPAKEKPVTITVRMPPALADRVDAECEKAGMKREPFIRAILEQVLTDSKFVLKVRG